MPKQTWDNYHREYYQRTRERRLEKLREWRSRNRERLLAKAAAKRRAAGIPEARRGTEERARAEAERLGVSVRTVYRRWAGQSPRQTDPRPTLIDGETVADAAKRLGVSERTVYRRLARERAL